MSKHRGEPVFKYEITVMESERGWGRSEWTEDYDSHEAAQCRIDYINSFNVSASAPDYYMQAYDEIRKVQQ